MDRKVLVEFTIRDRVESPNRNVSELCSRALDRCTIMEVVNAGLYLSGLKVIDWNIVNHETI